jgi:hypothetical protein
MLYHHDLLTLTEIAKLDMKRKPYDTDRSYEEMNLVRRCAIPTTEEKTCLRLEPWK